MDIGSIVNNLIFVGVGIVIDRWLGRNDAKQLHQELGEDVVQTLRRWKIAGTLEITRDERGNITAVTGGQNVTVYPEQLTRRTELQEPPVNPTEPGPTSPPTGTD